VNLRTAALQFSLAADVAVALVVGARSAQQMKEDYNSLQTKIPSSLRGTPDVASHGNARRSRLAGEAIFSPSRKS
jgi:aryl-alcohol dehydrogenase-like predicted oxidoreductase